MIANVMGLLLVLTVVATAWRAARLLQSPVAFIIGGFLFVWAEVVLIGFTLSAFHLLNSVFAWIGGAAVGLVSAMLLSKRVEPKKTLSPRRIAEIALTEWRATSPWQKVVLGLLGGATTIVMAINFALAIAMAPSCWDTLTYHLPRVAYFLQFGSLHAFPANYVYQVAHAKDGSLLLIFAFLGSGRLENAMQLVQFVAWCVCAVAVYGLARNAGSSRFASFVCGLVFLLLTECVMEAATCQNDLLIAVCGAGAAYFFLELRRSKNIWLAGLPVGLGLGTKVSFLPLFASLLVMLFAIPGPRPEAIRRLFILFVGILAFLVVFSLPAGYAENFRVFGNPVGTPEMIALDSNTNKSASELVKGAGRNLVRIGLEFISLDGLPKITPFVAIQRWIRGGPTVLAQRLIGSQLEEPDGPKIPAFQLERPPTTNENTSSWGPFGFLLIWPSVFLVICRRMGTREHALLAGAAVAFTAALAIVHPYDPSLGRILLSAAPFACAAVGAVITAGFRIRYLRYWIILVVAIGSSTAVSAALFRSGRPIIPSRQTPSVFALSRLEQMTVGHQSYREPIQRFDALVPHDATVAVLLPGDSYEFPLFGEGLTRRLIPSVIQWRETRTFPKEAQYVLFSTDILTPEQTDISLGQDWYLRVKEHEKLN